MTLITYEKIKYKELSCQTDLCNSPSIAKISTGILCTDGYYT